MKYLYYATLIIGTVGLSVSIVSWVMYNRAKKEAIMFDAKTKGWMKGYLAGDKKFAEYVKEKNPELFKEIESY